MVQQASSPALVAVRVRLFASFREAAGQSKIEQHVAPGARVRDLAAALGARFPALQGRLGRGMVAVNQEYVGEDFTLSPGDEVAFIPPVSGGA